jgi:predicted helicase
VAEWVRDHQLIELESGTVGGARDLAAAIALSMHFKQNQATRAISFHRSIAAARRFAALVGDIPELGVSTHHVSSRTPVAERFHSIQAFGREERSILTNARCLSEGVDLPSLDTVAFVDPRRSKVDIVQATGRALRRAIGKERGYVLIPALVPDDSSLNEEALTSIFRDVIDVVTALATEDERVVDQLRLQSAFLAGEATNATGTGGVLRWDASVPGAVAAKFDAVRDAITLQLWRRVARLQRRPFEEARS